MKRILKVSHYILMHRKLLMTLWVDCITKLSLFLSFLRLQLRLANISFCKSYSIERKEWKTDDATLQMIHRTEIKSNPAIRRSYSFIITSVSNSIFMRSIHFIPAFVPSFCTSDLFIIKVCSIHVSKHCTMYLPKKMIFVLNSSGWLTRFFFTWKSLRKFNFFIRK